MPNCICLPQSCCICLPRSCQLAEWSNDRPDGFACGCCAGRFDNLDDAILQAILIQVPFRQRLVCAIAVCKAWRSGLRRHSSLWTEIVVGSGWSRGRCGSVECRDQGLHRLLNWLPSLDAVTKLDICSDRNQCISPDGMKRAIARLSTSNLSTLSLRGKKSMAVVVITKAIKHAAGLKKLILGDPAHSGGACTIEKAIKDLIKAAPMLETLCIPRAVPFSSVIAAIKEARNGGDSLIRHLKTTNGGWANGPGIMRQDFDNISQVLPEIESFHTNYLNAYPIPPCKLPRLRSFCLSYIKGRRQRPFTISLYRYVCTHTTHTHTHTHTHCQRKCTPGAPRVKGRPLSTEQMGELINSILFACPVLEDLNLAHGPVYFSEHDREQGLTPPTLPGTNGSLLNLPSSLRRFLACCLSTIAVNNYQAHRSCMYTHMAVYRWWTSRRRLKTFTLSFLPCAASGCTTSGRGSISAHSKWASS